VWWGRAGGKKTDFAERRQKNGSSYGVFVCFASAHYGEETWLWTNMFELLLVCSFFASCCSKSELHLYTLSRILRLALLVLVISRLLHFCVFLGSLFTMTFLWVGWWGVADGREVEDWKSKSPILFEIKCQRTLGRCGVASDWNSLESHSELVFCSCPCTCLQAFPVSSFI